MPMIEDLHANMLFNLLGDLLVSKVPANMSFNPGVHTHI